LWKFQGRNRQILPVILSAGYCLDLNRSLTIAALGEERGNWVFIGSLNVLVSSFQERGIFGIHKQNSENDTLDFYSGGIFVFSSKDDLRGSTPTQQIFSLEDNRALILGLNNAGMFTAKMLLGRSR